MQVLEALKMTADRKNNPDNVYGWGLVNAYEAALYWGMIISNKPEVMIKDGSTALSTYVISKNNVDENNVIMYYAKSGDESFIPLKMKLSEKIDETNSGKYTVNLPFNAGSESIRFYFSANDDKTNRLSPYNAPTKFFYINAETKLAEIF
jgi:hypothetical protein